MSPSASPSASPSIGGLEIEAWAQQWKGIYLVKWEALRTGGNVGAPFACPSYPIKSIQVLGTWGGATITIQGSNMVDSPTYFTLEDPQGNGIAFTANGSQPIGHNTYWVRPSLSGGDATTDIDVYFLCVTER